MLENHLRKLLVLGAVTFASIVPASIMLAADEDPPLLVAMEELGDHVKALRKTVKDPAKNAESLDTVTKAKQAALTSKIHMPKMLEKAPEAERPKLIAGYRKAMTEVITTLCKLENQILDGKNAEAEETVKELKDQEEKGHEVYNP